MSADQRDRFFERGEHAEAEQVDLDDAHVGAVVLVPLHDAPIGHRGGLDRDDFVEATGGDHDAAAVLTEMAGQALDRADQVDPVADVRGLGVESCLAQARDEFTLDLGPGIFAPILGRPLVRTPLGRAAAGHGREVESRDQLREPADRLGILAEHLAHLPHGHLDAIGDDVRGHGGSRLAVFREDVLDRLLALVPARQVDVDVGPLAALFGEEAFEEQVHAHGVDGGDPERITDGAVGGRASTLAEDALLLRIAGDVLDDQEIAGEIELLDHVELVGELLLGAEGGACAIAFAGTEARELAEAAHLGLARSERVLGKAVVEVLERELTAFGDRPGREDPVG